MVAFLGNTALLLASCLAAAQLFISLKIDKYKIIKYHKFVVLGLLLFTLISFFSLMYSHIVSDFSIKNVFENSHTTKPLFYKISGVWGNHEGSMLLWILVLSIFNYFIYKLYNKNNLIFVSKILQNQAIICLGFLLFTYLTSNPFDKTVAKFSNGLGFNPILQDPALAIHPPLLYLGYVGFSAAFSISLAALQLQDNEKINWNIYMKPFVLYAWSFLTIGIALGSIWAYYELGWGGWWFWDPVENASFMPWLLGTALIHSLITLEKRKSLESWVLLLAILTFLLSVIGTFLVRSGILTSVHTFALDPSRGIYILSFTALLGIYSLALFGLKEKNYNKNNFFSLTSKEGTILLNNIIMIILCASVFLGTIYPLAVEVFFKNKISVGEPYYNSIVLPIMIPAIIVMGIAPIMYWKKDNIFKILKKSIYPIILTFFITITFFYIYEKYSLAGIIGIILASWIISNTLIYLFAKIFLKINTNYSIGMTIAHLGIGLLILGATGSSVWQEEKIIRMNINDEIKINKYNVTFSKIKEISGQNYIAIQGNFLVQSDGKFITNLKPENRLYPITQIFTSEVSIHTNLSRDLYLVLGEGNSDDGWVVRLYHNPLVIWIWLGSITIFIGGLLSVTKNKKTIKNY